MLADPTTRATAVELSVRRERGERLEAPSAFPLTAHFPLAMGLIGPRGALLRKGSTPAGCIGALG